MKFYLRMAHILEKQKPDKKHSPVYVRVKMCGKHISGTLDAVSKIKNNSNNNSTIKPHYTVSRLKYTQCVLT